jgi:MFS family permease
MGAALRYPAFRRYWFSNLAAVSGQQMMILAQGWLIYDLTDSPLYLGYAGLATALPAIVLNLVGGVMADRIDQRRLIAVTQLTTATLVFTIATLTVLDLIQPWHVLVNAFFWGAMQAFNNPARQSIFPQLIDKKDLMNAVSLNSMVWQATRVVAPATAGLLVAIAGTAAAFYVAGFGFLIMAISMLTLKVEREVRTRRASVLGDLVEGVAFIRNNFIFAFLIGMTFFNSLFGSAAFQLMPVFARDILDVGATGLGLFFSVGAIGSLIGAGVAGYLGDSERKGLLIVGGATLYGSMLVLFAASTFYPLSMLAFFAMGVSNQLYMVSIQTTLQMRVPDELRGRVMGVYGMTYNIGPLGGMQAGAVASIASAPIAVGLGGLAIIAFAVGVAASRPQVRRLQTPQVTAV